MAVRLMAKVERQFGRKLPLVWLFQDPTIERLADVLRSGEQPAVSLVPIRPRCRRFAAGAVSARTRRAARSFAIVNWPGYCPTTNRSMACRPAASDPTASCPPGWKRWRPITWRNCAKVQPAGPYRLLGWSLGGLIVFEMARQLDAQGQRTALVAIIDAGMIKPGETFDEDDFVPMLLQLFPDDLRPTEDELKNLSADQQLDFFRVRAEASAAGRIQR